jgi:hypothetical protein
VELHKGDVVEIRRQNRKARFRIVWVGEKGSARYGHVGVQSVDAPPNFWGLNLPTDGEVVVPASEKKTV